MIVVIVYLLIVIKLFRVQMMTFVLNFQLMIVRHRHDPCHIVLYTGGGLQSGFKFSLGAFFIS